MKPPNGRNYIARLTEYSGKTSFPLRWSISSVPGLTCKVTLSITPQEDHRRTERDKNNHADQQRGNGSGAPASPSREQTAKQLPAPELIAKAGEEKAKAELRAEEQEKEIARLRSENSALLEYKEKAYRELCRVRDEQKTIGKIKVNTDL